MADTLYNIARAYSDALDAIEIDPETGEVLNYEAADAWEGSFDEKAENTACYIKNLDGFVKALEEEAKTLVERTKTANKKLDGLKNYLSHNMLAVGKTKLVTPKCEISFRKSESVEITNENQIPEVYINVKVVETSKPDKALIKDAIKKGFEIPGAMLVEKQNLQIK